MGMEPLWLVRGSASWWQVPCQTCTLRLFVGCLFASRCRVSVVSRGVSCTGPFVP